MSELLLVGRHPDENRDLCVLELAAARLEGFDIPAERFGCFLVVDAAQLSDETIRGLARALLDAGAAYFATWGPGCERVHDLIDAECPKDEPGEMDVVMTTWLADKDLDEAIWESVYVAFPAGRYALCGRVQRPRCCCRCRPNRSRTGTSPVRRPCSIVRRRGIDACARE